MAMTFQQYVPRLMTAAAVAPSDGTFIEYIPNFINDAEQRCYRDLDLLGVVVRDNSATCTANSRDFTLPTSLGRFVVVNSINVVTPISATVTTGTRNPVTQLSLAAMDWFWPNNSAASMTAIPINFAMVTDQTIAFGPPPGNTFSIEVVGTIRPTPLSDSNTTTYLTLYLPDLFFAASMISVTGYQRDFGAQATDPAQGISWDSIYKQLLASANIEEQRKKFSSSGWTSMSPTPLAAQPR